MALKSARVTNSQIRIALCPAEDRPTPLTTSRTLSDSSAPRSEADDPKAGGILRIPRLPKDAHPVAAKNLRDLFGCVAAALHFGADVSDIGNALETLDIFDRGRLFVQSSREETRRDCVGSAASMSLVKSVPKPMWSMPTRRFKWSNSST